MKKSTIFRRAAEIIANGELQHGYSCHAIINSAGPSNVQYIGSAIQFYFGLFDPSNRLDVKHRPWWNDDTFKPCHQMARSLALLFAAEIAEDEGD